MRTPQEAIRNFVYFSLNYDYKFIEKCWKNEPHLVEHLKGKFHAYYKKDGATAVMTRFMCELDQGNQIKLSQWIDENYNEIKPEVTYRYFIFGEHASSIYHSEGFEELMKWLEKDGEVCLHTHSSEDTMDDFLSEYDGWQGYAEVTKDEYEQIKATG